MRFALAVTVTALLCALSPGVADAARHSTCAKPARGMHTGFKQGKVKLLWNYGADGQSLWYLCKPGVRVPKRWFEAPGYGLETESEKFRISGHQLIFRWFLDDGEGDYYWEIGFLDLRTAKRKAVEIDAEHLATYAIGADGTIAWVTGLPTQSEEISYGKPPGKGKFLIDVRDGHVSSLRVTATGVEWKGADGQTHSVPFSYKPPEWAFIRDFPIPTKASKPVSIAAGSDGALWFTEYGGNKIGRISVDGAVTEFKVPTANSHPDGIVAGVAGSGDAMWFTEGSGNKIGRINPAGQFTEFPVPTAKSEPASIAVAPDGELWFLERTKNKVGRMTPDGQFAEFKPTSRNLALVGLTLGPDGALWFGAQGGGGDYTSTQRIGRVTLDGRMTGEFGLDTLADAAGVLTAGPDGAVWFTEPGSDQVARLAGDGGIKVFKPPTYGSAPTGITAASDGALWFTEQSTDKIGRITTDGTITDYRLPTPDAGPFWITAGPDNALWFTEYDKNRIGRISLDVTGSSPSGPGSAGTSDHQ